MASPSEINQNADRIKTTQDEICAMETAQEIKAKDYEVNSLYNEVTELENKKASYLEIADKQAEYDIANGQLDQLLKVSDNIARIIDYLDLLS